MNHFCIALDAVWVPNGVWNGLIASHLHGAGWVPIAGPTRSCAWTGPPLNSVGSEWDQQINLDVGFGASGESIATEVETILTRARIQQQPVRSFGVPFRASQVETTSNDVGFAT